MALSKITNLGTLTESIVFDNTSKGIHLGVTSATASNLMDDYEEGTWTPRIKSESGEGTGTAYSSQQGRYTKIGDLVHCDFNVNVSTEGSFSGSYLMLAGLPFSISSNVPTVNLAMLYFYGLDDSVITIGLQADGGSAQAYIWSKTSSGTQREYLSITGIGTAELTGQFSYKV
tara:strand:+ start:12249 stop:12767 length:519 start_codon:yes stop_codon:yes gene_type:complete